MLFFLTVVFIAETFVGKSTRLLATRSVAPWLSGKSAKSTRCNNSMADTRGLICVDNAMWQRILEEDKQRWDQINATLRGTRDEKGRPLRARYYQRDMDYPAEAEPDLHTGYRRDYLQSVWVPTLSCPEEYRIGYVIRVSISQPPRHLSLP
jgi:hypothetical protein